MSCTALGTNPAIQDILICAIQMAAGGPMIAAILVFMIFMYAIYKARLPLVSTIPAFILSVFVFAGAGTGQIVGGVQMFENIILATLLLGGILLVLMIWRFRR